MMKLTDRPKLKRVWVALVVLIGILAVVGGSYGAYISQDAQRGVARNRDTDMIRFSSNYLQPINEDDENQYVGKIIAYSKDTSEVADLTIDIYVYNYVSGSNSIVNEKDITYDMSIKIVGGTQSIYQVQYEGNPLAYTKSGDDFVFEKKDVTLTGRAPNQHHYTVTVKGSDLDKVKIIAKADPQNKSYTGNQFLAGTIAPCTSSEVNEFSCKGEFTDSSIGDPKDYDGFNYEVSISGGRANVTLSWDSSLVEIDPYFLKKIGKEKKDISTESETEMSSIQFEMNQANGTGEYLIPFYLVSGRLNKGWTDMESVIKVGGDQIIAAENQTQDSNE